MSDIKILIDKEIKDFVEFMKNNDYVLRLEEEHSTITKEILQKYIDEYLESF